MPLEGKRILLGVSASIAAYKAVDLCSQLSKMGAEVHVVMTSNAQEFVGVPTFRALTRNPVLTDLFEEPHAQRIAHIDLAQLADLVLVAPATANVLAKMAHGIADDLLTTTLLAVPQSTPLLVAPAMNTQMWLHPATHANLRLLQSRGVRVVEPATGLLACQDVGQGKLAETAEILQAMEAALTPPKSLVGHHLLITAGATREPLDPVRFLSNRSSGKMGFALAEEALARGAQVTLVCGFTTVSPPTKAKVIRAETADAMLAACQAHFAESRGFIACAAVADYAPAEVATQKLKKSAENHEMVLRLRQNPDIVGTLAQTKRANQIVIGFAAETEALRENAEKKLVAKRLDLIVANDLTQEGAGFDTDTNIVTLFWAGGRSEALSKRSKREVAQRVLDAYAEISAEKTP